MKSAFEKILNGYEKASKEPLKEHHLAVHLRGETVHRIIEEAKIDLDHYTIRASAGQGGWAQIPWIAVFDMDISINASKGYDIVYLFAADMSGVYLSLNQGWTTFREQYGTKRGFENIEKVSRYWRNELSSALNDFDTFEIDLKTKHRHLARGYELGHICGKFYPVEYLPDTATMVNDLRNLLGVFRELKGKLAGSSFEDFNVEIVTDYELALVSRSDAEGETPKERSKQKRESKNASKLVESSESVELEEHDPPSSVGWARTASSKTPRKIDYETKSKTQAKIGLAGEKAVLEHERNKLRKAGKKKLADQIRHESLTNDSAGYDIRSFFADGREHFIEVKSTARSESEPFYISSNEFEFSKRNPEQFSIYRVHSMDPDSGKWKFYRYTGAISDHFQLTPMNYRVTYTEEN